ncbi:MAG TPA: histidine kinase [Longimicrobium sp.]|jgi:signal transduction histidine kinase|uniref:sensor histidine kinase n=1 Tax=Longimicrobium sp. TaxID=2029185 RepID=UPI002ED9ABC4
MRRSPRFWLVYASAWLPYAVLYLLIFLSRGRVGVGQALADVLSNVGTAAVLGVGALAATDRMRWPATRPVAFFVAQAALAVAYAAAWWAAIAGVFTLRVSLARGAWSPRYLGGYALPWQMFSGVMVYAAIAGIAYAVQAAGEAREQEARAARAETLRARAELQALRAQLNPHFLFNTLHSLMALVRHEPDQAEAALERFAGLLRYTLDARRTEVDDVPLSREWAFVRDYLALERIRLGERLCVEEHVDPEALDHPVPAFTLQPLVENAVRHAVAPHARGARVTIAIRRVDDTLELRVEDDGPGADPASVAGAAGLGLRVVRQRLEARYGGAGRMEVRTAAGEGFAVRVRLPVAAGGAETAEEERWSYAR